MVKGATSWQKACHKNRKHTPTCHARYADENVSEKDKKLEI